MIVRLAWKATVRSRAEASKYLGRPGDAVLVERGHPRLLYSLARVAAGMSCRSIWTRVRQTRGASIEASGREGSVFTRRSGARAGAEVTSSCGVTRSSYSEIDAPIWKRMGLRSRHFGRPFLRGCPETRWFNSRTWRISLTPSPGMSSWHAGGWSGKELQRRGREKKREPSAAYHRTWAPNRSLAPSCASVAPRR